MNCPGRSRSQLVMEAIEDVATASSVRFALCVRLAAQLWYKQQLPRCEASVFMSNLYCCQVLHSHAMPCLATWVDDLKYGSQSYHRMRLLVMRSALSVACSYVSTGATRR